MGAFATAAADGGDTLMPARQQQLHLHHQHQHRPDPDASDLAPPHHPHRPPGHRGRRSTRSGGGGGSRSRSTSSSSRASAASRDSANGRPAASQRRGRDHHRHRQHHQHQHQHQHQHLLHQPQQPAARHQRHPNPPSRPAPSLAAPGLAAPKPASPEVISSLITSLSVLAPPSAAAAAAPSGSLSLPASPVPVLGSFGVDYGAYNPPGLDDRLCDPVSLDDLAACPPVVRTSKPPSGFSSLTAPKDHRSASHDGAFGLRSLIRSRPSSRSSLASKNDDARSIGNLSVEPGSPLAPDLKPRRSHDSWGRRASRGSKGLMYATSKERLHERDLERRRASESAATPAAAAAAAAETSICEEPNEQSLRGNQKPVPARNSSLRGASAPTSTSTRRKRTSATTGPSRRDGDRRRADAVILETDERARSRDARRGTPEPVAIADKSFLLGLEDEFPAPPRSTPSAGRRTHDRDGAGQHTPAACDESAPYPSVSSGRRRDEDCAAERSSSRLSGRQSPGPRDALKLRRSNSRLKRLSAGPLSPRSESRLSVASPEPSHHASPPERPGSADSIDDAVESYLCSPRLSQKIRHPQTGRVVSFSEVGDPTGSAVFCCVGMGLTRYITAFYDELAMTLKLRLITPDRPGVGDSEPYSDGTATPLGWPDDVYAICQALKITKFSILAHSAGAIYALATALRMPQHIRGRIHLLAPWIPPSQMNVFGSTQAMPPTNAIPTSQKILRALPTPILKAANSSFMTATSSSITSSLPKTQRRARRKASHGKDPANGRNGAGAADAEPAAHGGYGAPELATATENMDRMQPPEGALGGAPRTLAPAADRERQVTYDTRLTHGIWELATTGANPAVDLLVCLERRHTIGFRYVDITRPVVIHHGSRDTRVPVDNVKWLGKMMRRCEVRVLEGEGHGLMASAAVMGSVLMEMSKEWEDWIRATGADGRRERGDRGRRGTLGGR